MAPPYISIAALPAAAAYIFFTHPTSVYATLVVLLAALVAYAEHALTPHSRFDLEKIPYPPMSPKFWGLLGHMPQLLRLDYHDQLLAWANDIGSVYRLWLPGHGWRVIVSDPYIAARVNNRGDDHIYTRTEEYRVMDRAMGGRPGHYSFFGTNDEELWRSVRKATGPAFSVANLRHHYNNLVPVFDWLLNKAAAEQQRNGYVDLEHMLLEMQAHATVETLLGCNWADMHARWPTIIEDVALVLKELNQQIKDPFRTMWMNSLLGSLTNKEAASFHAALQRISSFYLAIAEDIRSRPRPADSDTSLKASLWRLEDPVTGKLLTPQQLLPQVGIYFIAAFETSTGTIGWLCYLASRYPHHQEALYTELVQAGFAGANARPLSYDDLGHLPTVSAFINEGMRQYPVAAVSGSSIYGQSEAILGQFQRARAAALKPSVEIFTKEMLKPTQLGPYKLPKGSLVFCIVHAILNSKANWGEDANEFKPERWVDSNTMYVPGSKDIKRFVPFGDGPKNCVGQAFGLMIVRGVFLRLLVRFHVALHPDMGSHADLTKITLVALTTKLTMLKLVLQERQ